MFVKENNDTRCFAVKRNISVQKHFKMSQNLALLSFFFFCCLHSRNITDRVMENHDIFIYEMKMRKSEGKMIKIII